MLTDENILRIANMAAKTAADVLGVEKYSVDLIKDPSASEDALFNTQENKVLINLATIVPFSVEIGIDDEDKRLALKVAFVTYHEIRHAYQKKAVEVYTINQMLGSGILPMLESKKKCEMWLEELKVDGPEVEQDADAFAWYLLSRVFRMQLIKTNKHLGIMKRKYDKVEIK